MLSKLITDFSAAARSARQLQPWCRIFCFSGLFISMLKNITMYRT
jgi:hypothetical protein